MTTFAQRDTGVTVFPWEEPVTPLYAPQVCSKATRMQEFQRKSLAAELDLGQRRELQNEALDRIHEAQRWNTERQLGVVGLSSPVGPLTTSMVKSVADWVKPRDNTLLGAVGAAGRALPGSVGIMVGTFPMLAADSVRTPGARPNTKAVTLPQART